MKDLEFTTLSAAGPEARAAVDAMEAVFAQELRGLGATQASAAVTATIGLLVSNLAINMVRQKRSPEEIEQVRLALNQLVRDAWTKGVSRGVSPE